MLTFANKWNAYFKACFSGKKVEKTQELEMRRSFYAGAFSMMNLLMEISETYADHPEIDQQVTMKAFDEVKGELGKMVMEGFDAIKTHQGSTRPS